MGNTYEVIVSKKTDFNLDGRVILQELSRETYAFKGGMQDIVNKELAKLKPEDFKKGVIIDIQRKPWQETKNV
jgi:hypothetical protein